MADCEETQPFHRVSAVVDLEAIRENIRQIRHCLRQETKLMAVVKADAYGHGAVPVARALDELCDAFGVAIVEEGVELREAGIEKPLLILGYTFPRQYAAVVRYGLTQTIFQYETAYLLSEEAKRQGKIAEVHIKLDTGMSRIGFSDTEESIAEIKRIAALPQLQLTGIFTHLACADEADKASARAQLDRFCRFTERLSQEGISIPLRHCANSAATLDLPETELSMVRCGIATYGMYPSGEVSHTRLSLKPAMQVKSYVSYVKDIAKGTPVSYNATYIAPRDMRLATVPVGYGDGYPRRLSSVGRVLIHGQSAPIVGRVCMDQFMVDVTEIPQVRQEDVVTLVGQDGAAYLSVDEVAQMAGSFQYEFVCNVGKRIPRVYLE